MEQSNPTLSHETRGIVLAISSVICFTVSALLLSQLNVKYGVDGWVAAAYRGFVGLCVIFIIQSRSGKVQLHHIVTNRLLFMRGLLGGSTIPLFYICIMQLGPGRSGLIYGSYPLFAAVFAMFLIKEGLHRNYFLYIAIALLGLFAVFAENGIGGEQSLYDGIALCGAAVAGICVVMIRHLRHTENTSTIFAAQCVFTLLICAVVARERIFIGNAEAFVLTLLAAFIVAIAQLCVTESFRHLSVAKGSTLQMLTPPMTVVLSALFIGEQFSALELIGGAAILFASYRIVLMKAKA